MENTSVLFQLSNIYVYDGKKPFVKAQRHFPKRLLTNRRKNSNRYVNTI